MLAEVRTAKDAKKLMDMAAAAELYSKKAKLGEEAEAYARAIKIDAQTLLGEFINQTIENSRGRPKLKVHSEPLSKSLEISTNVRKEARYLARAKIQAPELHQAVRNGHFGPRKLRELLKTPQEQKEDGKRQRRIITTKYTEKTVAVLLDIKSFSQLDPTVHFYTGMPEYYLTPERMEQAAANLLKVAKEWRDYEKQKRPVEK